MGVSIDGHIIINSAFRHNEAIFLKGGLYFEVITREVKASQYNHLNREYNKKKLSLSLPSALAKINIGSYDVSFSVNSGNYKLIGEDYGISATQRLVFYGDPIFACIHPGRDDSRKDMMTTYYVNAYKI